MYDRILIPTDGSAGMESVISHASALAEAHGSEIHALYVVDTGRFSTLPSGTTWESVSEMLNREGEAALDAVDQMVDGDVSLQQATSEGNPSHEIVEYARQNDCDLIVMGTHGRGGIDRLLLGSVAERVVRSSHVPVVTVPVEAAMEESTESERPTGVTR